MHLFFFLKNSFAEGLSFEGNYSPLHIQCALDATQAMLLCVLMFISSLPIEVGQFPHGGQKWSCRVC